MAQLIPQVSPETIDLTPERDVAIALVRDLPNDCIVYHSYCWLKPDRDHSRHPLTEGEADFLILDPRFGLLVLEVKGGYIRHRIRDGDDFYYRQVRHEERPIGNPFSQARHNLHEIEDILELKRAPWLTGCYGYAVIFPENTLDRTVPVSRELPHDAAAPMVMYAEHLDNMDVAVRSAFNRYVRRKNSKLTAAAVDRCRQRLKPVFRLITARWRDMERDDETLVQLTEQQQVVLAGLQSNNRLAVRGGAGTGKTMLALWMADSLARQQQNVLLLCYNSGLAKWLNEQADAGLPLELRSKVLISTFHGLCRRFFDECNLRFQPPKDSEAAREFWSAEVPNTMFDFLLDQLPQHRFDSVIVDEGQDFDSGWWMVVESLLQTPMDRLYVFHDPHQNLFDRPPQLPSTNAVYDLSINCRNTRRIHEQSLRYLKNVHPKVAISAARFAPEGAKPQLHSAASLEEELRRCEDIISSWQREYRLSASQIAILSPRRRGNSSLAGLSCVCGTPIVDDPAIWRTGKGILFSTAKSFKGLEADAVILLNTSESSSEAAVEQYVASSRAKHLLAVVQRQQAEGRSECLHMPPQLSQ